MSTFFHLLLACYAHDIFFYMYTRIVQFPDESQCHGMLCEGLVESVARTMEALHNDSDVQTAAIATLATAMAHGRSSYTLYPVYG